MIIKEHFFDNVLRICISILRHVIRCMTAVCMSARIDIWIQLTMSLHKDKWFTEKVNTYRPDFDYLDRNTRLQ